MGLGPGLLLTGFEDPGNKIRVHSVWAEVEVGMEGQRTPARAATHPGPAWASWRCGPSGLGKRSGAKT